MNTILQIWKQLLDISSCPLIKLITIQTIKRTTIQISISRLVNLSKQQAMCGSAVWLYSLLQKPLFQAYWTRYWPVRPCQSHAGATQTCSFFFCSLKLRLLKQMQSNCHCRNEKELFKNASGAHRRGFINSAQAVLEQPCRKQYSETLNILRYSLIFMV